MPVPDDELPEDTDSDLELSMTAGEWRGLGCHGEHVVIREELRRNNLLN